MDLQQQLQHEMTIADYFALALRRKWIILSAFIIVFSAAAYYVFTSPNKYSSASTFIVESKNMSGIGAELVFEKTSRPFGFYEKVLHSSAFHKYIYEMARTDSVLITIEEAMAFVNDEFFNKYISIAETEYEDLIELRVTAYDPVIAFRLADIATESFQRRCREIELEESHNIVDFVNTQIEQARTNLEQAERDLQTFEKKTNINPNFSEGGILKRLGEIENELSEIESKRQLSQANLASFRQHLLQIKNVDSGSIWDVESPQATSLRNEIDNLEAQKNAATEKYGSSSNVVASLDRQLDQKKNDFVQFLINKNPDEKSSTEDASTMGVFNERVVNEELDLYTLRNREQYLKNLIEQYRLRYPNILENNIEMAQLQRAKTVNENLYNFLIEKAEEAKINAATGTGGVRIVDSPGMPSKPISKNSARNLLVGLIFGLGFGLGLAFVIDYFDNAIYTPEDLKRLGDPNILGTVPQIRAAANKGNATVEDLSIFENRMNGYRNRVISMNHAKGPVSDSYRQIRTNLQFSNVDRKMQDVLVTSSIPSEGKTLTASNLAISFAEMGKRVLVVDCDLRRSHQHVLFNVRKSPGLSNYLAGQTILEKVIYLTSVPNLYVIPAGTNPPNPAEMLASERMNDLVKRLRQTFDIIVYDTPPVIAVTDPILLVRHVQNVVMVIRYGKTNRHLVDDSMKRLVKANASISGVILNAMINKRGYGYYKYNYHYYQKSYYGENTERTITRKTTILN